MLDDARCNFQVSVFMSVLAEESPVLPDFAKTDLLLSSRTLAHATDSAFVTAVRTKSAHEISRTQQLFGTYDLQTPFCHRTLITDLVPS